MQTYPEKYAQRDRDRGCIGPGWDPAVHASYVEPVDTDEHDWRFLLRLNDDAIALVTARCETHGVLPATWLTTVLNEAVMDRRLELGPEWVEEAREWE